MADKNTTAYGGRKNSYYLSRFLKGGIHAFVIAVISNIVCTLCVTVVPLIISFTIDSVLGAEPVTGIFAEAV